MKTKTLYFSVNFQVQGFIFSLIVYQFEVSLHPREVYATYISTANLIICRIHLQIFIKSDLTYLPQQLFTVDCSVDDGLPRGRRIGIPGVMNSVRHELISRKSLI